MKTKKKMAIFASGAGSNATKLMSYFSNHPGIEVALLVTNNAECGAIKSADALGITSSLVNNVDFIEGETVLEKLKANSIDYIVLAGFLRKIPSFIISHYENKIINLHPSLLPKYGGKGMYGDHVHKKVKENADKETGITVHLVDEVYDSGQKIAQFFTSVLPNDNVDQIRSKIKKLEYHYFPPTVEQFILLNS